jgi:protein transport protein SEC23
MQIQEKPEYEYFADFLKTPVADAQAIMSNRFPVPAYIECDQGKSASRFLMAKLNPSITHTSGQGGYGQQDQQPVIFTDDVPMKVFLEHLKKYAVSGQ